MMENSETICAFTISLEHKTTYAHFHMRKTYGQNQALKLSLNLFSILQICYEDVHEEV